jgi:S1-C subfamily serine protease
MTRAALPLVATVLLAAGCEIGGGDDAAPTIRTQTVQASSATGADSFDSIPEIVREVEPKVVTVLVETAQGDGQGSGVVWDADGTIVTNNHVVEGASKVEVVLASGRRLDATVKATDQLTDLALLEVDAAGLPAAEFAESLPEVGELAVAIGNPLGFQQTVTAGIVSGLHRAIPSGGQTPALVDLIQTDAAISPGNSGGALVNRDGEVMGINVAFIPPEQRAVSIGFAIPAPTVTSVIEDLEEDGEAEHAFLGVRPTPVTDELDQQFDLGVDEGALVQFVEEGSAAEEGGIEQGDVIVAVGGAPVRTVEDLFAALRRREPGEEVTVEVVRDGKEQTVTVTLDERPAP